MTKYYPTEQFRLAEPVDPAIGRSARRIAIVVHSLNAGGAQQRLVTLANAFAEAGRQVDFVALRGGGDVDRLLDPRVRVTVLKPRPKPLWKPWFFEGWGRLGAWLSSHRPDVVLGGATTVHFSALVACATRHAKRRPLLVLRASRHPERDFPWSRPFKRLFEPVERAARWRIYNRADLVIAVSGETAQALRPRLDRPERCTEIANPVVTPAFVASLGKDPPHPWLAGPVPAIVAVGRLAWQKRFDLLLDALAIARRTREVRLIILGEGHLRRRLEGKVRRLDLSDAVAMPGRVADVGAWIGHSRLLVSTSAFEGSPAALVEALAASVPVVATGCPGGSQELLAEASAGMLVPMDDPDATAAAILATLDQPRRAAKPTPLVAKYTAGASAASYLAALDQAVSRRGDAAESNFAR